MATSPRRLRLAYKCRVVVADGRKAIYFRNDGDADYPNLKTERVLHNEPNPPTREQATDRPGRFAKGFTKIRGAFEQTDLHQAAERAFARRIATDLGALATGAHTPQIVLVAAPRMLGEIRAALDRRTRASVAAEIAQDLVRLPVHEIERLLLHIHF